MDQSKSNSSGEAQAPEVALPRRTFTVEFFVGVFTMLSLACFAYLAVGLGGLKLADRDRYLLNAEFDNISGLKFGAPVEIAGVPVGEVVDIRLKESIAVVRMKISRAVQIRDDDIASIRTKGIIGDRYVKISRGASGIFVPEGGTMTETESVVDIEDIIGKIVHSLGGDKEEKESKEQKED